MRYIGLATAALALLGLGAPQASACGWLWPCAERAYVHRDTPRTYGYRDGYRGGYTGPRGYGYRSPAWAYGYTSPARAYGYPYAAWSSTQIPTSRWYLGTALPGASTDAVGLSAPVYSATGLLVGGMPAGGPSLFGPNGGYYGYGAPAYGYIAVPTTVPPPETPSWWVEPRRRR